MARRLFGELNEICWASIMKRENEKPALARNSSEFNDFVKPQHPHGRPFSIVLDRPYIDELIYD